MSRVTDGTSGNRLNATVSLNAARDFYTVLVWVKILGANSGGPQMLFNTNSSTVFRNPRIYYYDTIPANMRCRLPPFVEVTSGGTTFAVDAWHCVIARRSATGNAFRLRVNGVEYSVNDTAAGLPTDITDVQLGGANGISEWWLNGKLAHCAAWNRELSVSECQALEGGANPLTIEGSRWFYYPLTDASLDNAFTPDNSDTAGALSVTGTVTSDTGDNPTVDAPPSAGPVLSDPAVTSITQTGATVNYSTDTAGTAYIVKTTSATEPSAAQIKAGQNHTGAAAVYAANASVASGARSFTTSGGSASTLYYWYIILNDGTDDSNVLSGSFTTSAAVGATHPFTSVNIGG